MIFPSRTIILVSVMGFYFLIKIGTKPPLFLFKLLLKKFVAKDSPKGWTNQDNRLLRSNK
jgi:hypothetical protein